MLCLIVQKDTLENNKVKSILKVSDSKPSDFVSLLQEQHCIPYQLVSYVENYSELVDRLSLLTNEHKTLHGRDWYEFDHDVLAKIISLFLEYNSIFLDLKTISSIFGFSLKIFPVVTKEIRIISKDDSRDSKENVREVREVRDVKEVREIKDVKEKELVTMIENLQESEIPKRRKDKKK